MTSINIASALAVYFIIWWITLFIVLPWGIVSQLEAEDVAPGTEPGAPSKVRGIRIIAVTTFLSLIIFCPLYFYWEHIAQFLLR